MGARRILTCAALAACTWTGVAHAAGRVTAVFVEGFQADHVGGWIEDQVTAPDRIEEGDDFRRALQARRALPLRAGANSPAHDIALVAHAVAAARDIGVDDAILVDVQKTGHATRVHVWRLDPHRDTAVVDAETSLAATASAIDATRAAIALASRDVSPDPPSAAPVAVSPPSPSPTPAAPALTPPAGEADRVPAPARDVGNARVELEADLGIGMRHFSYVDRVTPTLRPYDLDATPMTAVSAAAYPFAFLGTPILRDLGLTGSYAQAFAVTSQDAAGSQVSSSWRSFDVGLTQRFAIARSLSVRVLGGYGGNDFQFDGALFGTNAALPSVSYRFVRVGAEVRWHAVAGLTVFGGGSYLDVLSSGYAAELFPRESVAGIEGSAGLAYRLAPGWEASLRAAYTRMFFSFNPVPGDADVAGGALDEQTRVLAGVAYRL